MLWTDGNQRVTLDDVPFKTEVGNNNTSEDSQSGYRHAIPGDYLRVYIESAGVTRLDGRGLALTTLSQFASSPLSSSYSHQN